MKKTIIALATAAVFATSANAATVYEKDGTKLEIGGSVRVLLSKESDKRGDLNNDGSRLEVKANHDLGNGLSALGALEVRFDDEKSSTSFGNPTTNKLYAGLAYEGLGTVTFGKQATNGDDVQLNDNAYAWGGNNNLLDSADKSIKFRSAEMHGFSFGVDYLFGNAEKKNLQEDEATLDYKYGYQTALFYTRALAQDLTLNLAAGYGVNKYDFTTTKTAVKDTNWRTSAQLVYGPVTFGAEYGQEVAKDGKDKKSTTQTLLVSASYQILEPSKVYVQWKNERAKTHLAYYDEEDNKILPNEKTTWNGFIVGADYKLHKNVVTYVEYAHERATYKSNMVLANKPNEVVSKNEKATDNKVGVGLRVFF